MATKTRRGKPLVVRVCAPDEEAKLAALKLLAEQTPNRTAESGSQADERQGTNR